MDSYSELLLQLYRASRDLSINEFPQFAFCLLKSVVRFDSARYTALKITDGRSVVQRAHLHNDATDTVFDWEQINRYDTVVRTVTAEPGKAFAFHAPTLFSAREQKVMRDYTQRVRHENMIVCAHWASPAEDCESVSLYRASSTDQFADGDRRLVEQLTPHFLQALRINAALGAAAVGESSSIAMATRDGTVHYAGAAFVELLREEWTGNCAVQLPPAVLHWAAGKTGDTFRGRCLTLDVHAVDDLLFLRARPKTALEQLSAQEYRVAVLYGGGASYKQIARELAIAPATARNHLQHIFGKLGIRSKAQLGLLLARESRPW